VQTIISDSRFEEDKAGLSSAYAADMPLIIGDTLYVPGTRRFRDFVDDAIIFTPYFKQSVAYLEGLSAFHTQRVERVVGHSLGGAVAAELGKEFGVFNVGYGSPVKNTVNYADRRDPVGALVKSQHSPNSSFLHHADPSMYSTPFKKTR